MEFPQENELNSFFKVLPERKNEAEEFHFDTATYRFFNDLESFEVVLSPFYNEFTMIQKDLAGQHTINRIKLRSVEKLEIITSIEQTASLRIYYGKSDSYIQLMEMGFRPEFKMMLVEQYL